MINYKILKNINFPLMIITFIIISIGIFFIYSASYQIKIQTNAELNYCAKQVLWVIISFICFFVIIFFFDYEKLYKLAYPFFIINIILLILVEALGSIRYGAQRWLDLGGLIIQPSEFAKLSFILAMAKYLSHNINQNKSVLFIIKPLIITFIPLFLILTQPDLGTSLIFIPILLAMLFVGGASLKYMSYLIISGLTAAPFMWFALREYQRNRIRVFWDPNLDPAGLGYQSIQSKIAIGAGGLFGKGWLHGTQNQLNFLPKRYTDFIFSVIGEEWGFVGVCGVLLLFLILVVLCVYIASKSKDIYGKLLATGISFLILAHVFINIGMTVGIMPITGLPLLMMSYGGSSMLTSLVSIAILQSIWIKRKNDI